MQQNITEEEPLSVPPLAPQKPKGVSGTALKLLAIFAMTIDHVTMLFMPVGTAGEIVLYQFLRIIGRLTAVIMCSMCAEGMHYTHNAPQYLGRLLLFAIISHVPYVYMHGGTLFLLPDGTFQTSIMWAIFLGCLALAIVKNKKLHLVWKILLVAAITALSIPSDWNVSAIAMILVFGIFRDKPKLKYIAFSIVATVSFLTAIWGEYLLGGNWYDRFYMIGMFLAFPFLMLYNGTRGKAKHLKWGFYIYYPLHMLILGLIAFL